MSSLIKLLEYAPRGAKRSIVTAIGKTKAYSTALRLIFIILDVMVVEAPAKSPTALATVKSTPKKCKIGMSAMPEPAPPIEKRIERIRVMTPYKR